MNLFTHLDYLNPIHVHEPVFFIVKNFLDRNGYAVYGDALQAEILRHPNKNTLLCISDILKANGYSHIARKIDFDTLVSELSKPVVASLNTQGGIFVLILKANEKNVQVLTEKDEIINYTVEEFKRIWPGAIISIQQDRNADRRPSDRSFTWIRILTGIAFLLFVALFSKIPFFNVGQCILLLLSIAGLSISWMLILQGIDKNNPLVRQMCQANKQQGCQEVMESMYANITSWLSWAEAGYVYFGGIVALLLFSASNMLATILILSAPIYTLYAIWIQAFVLKKWCRLCLVVHITVISQAVCVIIAGFSFGMPALREFILFIIPGLVFLSVKPFIHHLRERKLFKGAYYRVKTDPEIFTALMKERPKIIVPDMVKTFQLGNLASANELTIFSNPFCGPCAATHEILDKWLSKEADLKITIIFGYTKDERNHNRKVDFIRFLASVSPDQLALVLGDWFKSKVKDVEAWSVRNKLNQSPLPYEEEMYNQFMKSAGVMATPTYLVNGILLHENYDLEDIKYLIEQMN